MRRGNSQLARAALIVIAALCAMPRGASAQTPPVQSQSARTAEEQYNRGRDLMKAQRFREAAEAFEASQKLDPGWGTLYSLAQCYERTGKLATAQAMYRELARPDSYPRAASVTAEYDLARRKDATKRADALDKRVPRLRLSVAAPVPGLAVLVDGIDATRQVGSEKSIDLGAHKIHASAPGHKDFDTTTTIADEGKTVAVAIELAADPAHLVDTGPRGDASQGTTVDTAAKPAMPEPVPHAPSQRKTYALITAAGGGVLVVTGLVFGQLASSKWKDAQDACTDKVCPNAGDVNDTLVSDARSRATVSTVLVIGGAVAVAAGAVVYLTAPRVHAPATAWRLTPGATPGGVSLTLDGAF